jgi:hypothetical protein
VIHRGGAAAALAVLALWYAAPLIGSPADTPASRLRNALILGTAIPFVLALLGVFSPIAFALVLAAVVLARTIVRRPQSAKIESLPPQVYWMPALIVIALAWPQIVRPLLDGDSLAYHLPNAAAWMHAHSLWTTTTYYWWYPPASELFAAGLMAISGPFSLGLAGTGALLLLGFRIAEWSSKFCNPWIAAALSCATISIPSMALQAGNLQNDVWLAAFFVEALWACRFEEPAVCRSIATLSLMKPIGVLSAAIVQISNARTFRIASLACYIPFAVWVVHDAVLAPHAMVHTPHSSLVEVWKTTIAGQGLLGLQLLAAALAREGIWTVMIFLSALALTPVFLGRSTAVAGYLTLIAYLVLPFAYETAVPQLATGHSLRFLAPLFALGTPALAASLKRVSPAIAILPGAVAIWNVWNLVAIFWNDTTVHNTGLACGVAAAVTVAALIVPARWMRIPAAMLFVAFVMWAHELAIANPAPYFNDAVSSNGRRTHFFSWIQTASLQRAVVQDLRSGTIDIVAPHTVAYDADKPHACEQARELAAALVIGPDAGAYTGPSCGTIVYSDPLVRVYRP